MSFFTFFDFCAFQYFKDLYAVKIEHMLASGDCAGGAADDVAAVADGGGHHRGRLPLLLRAVQAGPEADGAGREA